MTLNLDQIVTAAASRLRAKGLPGLSMRGLAQDLDVQPGALYHYVASKQDLLAAVGELLLADDAATISTTDPAQAAADIRAALLPIRDGAEVISFVHAYKPQTLKAFRNLHLAFAKCLPEADARAAAEALIRFVLGFVAVEQNRAELVRARVVEPGATATGARDTAAFTFGVSALLSGLKQHGPKQTARSND